MDSATASTPRANFTWRSLGLLFLGMILGASLTLAGLWYHIHPGGMAAHVAGEWTGTASVAGTEVNISLTLEKIHGTFSGQLTATPGGTATLQDATIDSSGNISFTITVSGESATFTGKASPDLHSMAGTIATTSYGNGTWMLTRQS